MDRGKGLYQYQHQHGDSSDDEDDIDLNLTLGNTSEEYGPQLPEPEPEPEQELEPEPEPEPEPQPKIEYMNQNFASSSNYIPPVRCCSTMMTHVPNPMFYRDPWQGRQLPVIRTLPAPPQPPPPEPIQLIYDPRNYLVFPDTGSPSRRRDNGRVCRICNATTTPLWRKGPNGRQTLCNACGLKHLRNLKKE